MLQDKALRRAPRGTGQVVDFTGNWKNALHSRMTLIQKDGKLTGSYTSKVSDEGGETAGDLQGYVDGDLIAFVVHWDDYQAITSWVGQSDPGASELTIQTLWQMTKQVEEGEEWASINSGFDAFTRI